MFNSFIIAIGTLLLLLTIEAKRVDNPPPEAPILPEQVQAGQSATIGGHQIHKLKKPKSLKTITDYELCKQECKRKRDQESMGEYVQWLQEELKFAEEQRRAQLENQQQNPPMGQSNN